MFLKKIEVENFKSFGRKTVIEFRSGYTSVTGPNASGKSNIGDALLFVLGTKSNKSLRAQKLSDLIHRSAGGRTSPFLKASVTFDNSDKSIPLDSNEVTFTRIVKLSESNGQDYSSAYYINDDKARLQDFEYLLEKVKIFADGYNFVRQGDITQIVEMTSLERRGILEEVGGISVYNTEIEKANNEKDKTKENMVTVHALISELGGRVELLSHEKEQAEIYLSKKKEIERHEAVLLFRKKHETENQIEAIKEQVNKINSEINSSDEKVKELLIKNDELEKKLNELKENSKELEDFQRVKNDLDQIKLNYAKAGMEKENLQGSLSQIKKDISDLASRKKKLDNEVKRHEATLKGLEDELRVRTDEARELELTIQDMENKSTASVDSYEKLSQELSEMIKEKEEALNEIARHESKLSSIDAKNSSFIDEISRAEEELGTLEFSLKDTDWRIKNLKKGGGEGVDLNKTYLELRKKTDEVRKEIEDISLEVEKGEGELGKIQGVKLSGIWEIINFINSESSDGHLKGIKGTVDSLISYSEQHEKAVRAAGGNRLFSIVVEKDEDAQAAIELLKKKGRGRLTFLPLNKIIPLRPRGKAVMLSQDKTTLGFLSEKITADDSLRDIVSYVFSDTILVPDIKKAREVMGGVRLVTLDGDLIDPSNAMTGGTLPRREVSRDIEGLNSKLSELKSRRGELRNTLSNLEDEFRATAEKLNRAHAEAGKSEGETGQLVERKKELEDQMRKKKEFIQDRKVAREAVLKEEQEVKSKIEGANSKFKKINEGIERVDSEKEKTLDKATREEIRSLKQKLAELKGNIDNKTVMVGDQKVNLTGFKANLESAEESIESKQDELSRCNKSLDETESTIQKIKIDLDAVTKMYSQKESMMKEKGEEFEKITSERFRVRSEIDSKTTIKKTKIDFLLSLQTKLDEATSRISEIEKTIGEKKLEYQEDQRSQEEIRKEISVFENQLREMEPINLKSISDYQEEKGRLEELLGKKERLEGEMNRLGDLERKLEEQKKIVFLEVFDAVNKNFIDAYKELTAGQEGYLVLENVTNPFEGGLLIRASSKGKKIDNLASLSGGEKSIAALTLILAIQIYDPSPIYFMDEVDMFLDGVNAENVGRLFRRNSENAQIIAVTLRRATMKYAHQVIGVTFQDKNSIIFTKEFQQQGEATS